MLDKITVGQYQQLYSIQKSDLDELDKITESVAVITGKNISEIEEMQVTDFNSAASVIAESFNKEIPAVNPKKIIKCDKGEYGLTYVPALLNRGQYVTVMHFMNGDLVDNCHLILASITYNPKTKKHEADRHLQIAEDIKSANFLDIYAACVFFCDLFKTSINSLRDYFVKELKKKGEKNRDMEKLMMDLTTVMDGYTMPNRSQILKA